MNAADRFTRALGNRRGADRQGPDLLQALYFGPNNTAVQAALRAFEQAGAGTLNTLECLPLVEGSDRERMHSRAWTTAVALGASRALLAVDEHYLQSPEHSADAYRAVTFAALALAVRGHEDMKTVWTLAGPAARLLDDLLP